jgi:hypothetical protein
VLVVGNTSWSGYGEDPKSLGMIEASVNISVEVKNREVFSSLSEALGSCIYSLKEGSQSVVVCHVWELRC